MKSKKSLRFLPVFLAALFIAVMAVPSIAGAAEQPLTVKNMKISLWPEYDDPRILVIVQGEFNNGSSFPKPVKFPIQVGSEINQVCALKQPGDEHLCQLYDTVPEGDALAVSYTLPIPTYFLEYYWDGVKGQPDKSFNYKYVAPYAVDKLELEVQQPLKATDFKLTPAYLSSSTDAQGMKYYRYLFNNVSAGQELVIDGSYAKADNKPSVAKRQVNTSSGGPNYALVGIGAAAVAVFFIGFIAMKRRPAPARAQVRRAARVDAQRKAEMPRLQKQEPKKQARPVQQKVQPAAAPPRTAGGSVFCSKCGARLEAGDAFCSGCGQRTKRTSN
ncbi:MAG: zinc ribbon domain-containing protein [Chloroflexi bacterium]|nr:zinc ribbon domain-containing protein [Chloroflexota bacterium]